MTANTWKQPQCPNFGIQWSTTQQQKGMIHWYMQQCGKTSKTLCWWTVIYHNIVHAVWLHLYDFQEQVRSIPAFFQWKKECHFTSSCLWWSRIIITFVKAQGLSTYLFRFCMRTWDDDIVHFYTCPSSLFVSRKDTGTNNWVAIWYKLFLHGLPFVLGRTTEKL